MGLGYDIFRELGNGEVLWVGCVAELDQVRSRLALLGTEKPSRYFVRSAMTGEIVANFDLTGSSEACA